MANEKLQSIVEQLNGYFNISTKEDLVLSLLTPNIVDADSSSGKTLLGSLASNIISTAEGSSEIRTIIKRLSNFASDNSSIQDELKKFITIYTSKGTTTGLQAAEIDLEKILGVKNVSRLSLLILKDINLLPAGRDNNAVTLFLNSIPTLEFSRCVPYLNIQIYSGRSPISKDKRVQSLSLAKFLEGSFSIDSNVGDEKLVNALGNNSDKSSETIAGMEIFTSPQTLINSDSSLDLNRATAVIDKFRPFLTIESFTAEISPHVGFFAYYTAELNIILHDRSRLADIADFIRPDLYSNTELFIEYGWSHPDNDGTNIFGSLLNQMRTKQKFRVVNSSFSFTNTGQVKLKLQLATKGASDFQTIRISDSDDRIPAAEAIRRIESKIADLRKRTDNRSQNIKEIRGQMPLYSMAEDLTTALSLTQEQRKQLMTFIGKRNRGNESIETKELRDALIELYGPRGDGTRGIAKDFLSEVSNVVEKKIKDILLNNELEDPMLNVDERIDSTLKQEIEKSKRKLYVSFGKLMGIFIGSPLAQSPNYSDVQLLFYPFNEKAGAMGGLNISNFAININELRLALNAIARSRRGVNIPLREFIQFIMNNFIDDMGSINYGLKGLYNTIIDEKSGTRKLKSKQFEDVTKLLDEQEARLRKITKRDGSFKMPVIDILIETVPGAVIDTGETEAISNEKTILKIHFFDKTATRYECLGDRLRLERDGALQTMGARSTSGFDLSNANKVYNQILEAMKSEGLIAKINDIPQGSDNVYEIAGGVDKVKKFITSNMPTIEYGTNNSAVIDANFRTIQDKLLSTVHMIRAGDAGPLSPTGLSTGNLPLQTLPATISLKTFGCPLVYYMQQFFIDFKTNTTADNIYGVNKFKHEISPGKFFSTWEMVPLDAYGEYKSLSHHIGVAIKEFERNKQ